MQAREGVASRVVVPGNMQEAERDHACQEQAGDHAHWDVQGELVSVNPPGGEGGGACTDRPNCSPGFNFIHSLATLSEGTHSLAYPMAATAFSSGNTYTMNRSSLWGRKEYRNRKNMAGKTSLMARRESQ